MFVGKMCTEISGVYVGNKGFGKPTVFRLIFVRKKFVFVKTIHQLSIGDVKLMLLFTENIDKARKVRDALCLHDRRNSRHFLSDDLVAAIHLYPFSTAVGKKVNETKLYTQSNLNKRCILAVPFRRVRFSIFLFLLAKKLFT